MGVVHPGILAGLCAIALPVLIHFIRTRKYERVEVGTLRFLKIAIQEKRRWRRIDNWPLLLARIGLVALLTLVFARPFFPAREKVEPGDLEAVILVDVSGSVSGTGFEEVRAAAREALSRVPPGAKVTVAAFADEVKVETTAGLDALNAIPGARTDFAKAVNWTIDHLAQSDRKHGHVYLVSDLQQSGLPAAPPRVWPANIRATVVPVPTRAPWNAGIASAELLTPFLAEDAEMEVNVAISGDAPAVEREVRWEMDGRPPEIQKIGASGGRLRFTWKPGRDTLFSGTIAIQSTDSYPEDNRRPFAFRLAEPKRVMLVEGSNPASPFDGDAYFLGKALLVSGKERAPSPFATRVQQNLKGIESAHVVALCDVPGLTDEDARALADYVRKGGAAAFFLGKNTQGERFVLASILGLFPGKLERVGAPAPRAVETWDKAHPMLTAFDGRESGDLRSIVLRDAFTLEADADWKVLARLENGHPAMLARELGKGRVLVFCNPLTRAWSDLPRERIFLPLVKEWFTWLTQLNNGYGTPREIAPGMNEARTPGVYRDGEKIEVVAPDAAEMNVVSAGIEATRRALALPSEKSSAVVAEDAGLPNLRERQNEVWPWIALALLALMIFENRLADRRTKRRNANPA